MKKTYSKPDILFESFSLSTNIATGCDYLPTNLTTACPVKWAQGVFLFLDSSMNCTHLYPSGVADEKYNSMCYHNPSDDRNVFTS